MKLRIFLVIVLLGNLLAATAGSAMAGEPQPAKTVPPPHSPVVKAFNETEAACNGQTMWDVNAPVNAWINVGIDWTAKTAEIAQDNWQHISWEIAVDGRSLADLDRYKHGPEPKTIDCLPAFRLEGWQIVFRAYVPPLSVGHHVVTWKITLNEALSDGWFDYPAGMVIQDTATLHVSPPAAHPDTHSGRHVKMGLR